MSKERKQDLRDPEEEAVEQRVKEMLDVNVPDKPETPPEAPAGKSTSKSVPVTFHDDEPAKEDPELTAAIEATNAALAGGTTAPLVTSVKKTAPKKVEVLHDEETASVPEPATVEPVEPEPIVEQTTSIEEVAEPETSSEPAAIEAEEVPDIEVPAVDDGPTVGELIDAESSLETTLNAPETDQAVSDIIAHESDELLAVQDKKTTVTEKKPKKKRRGLFGLLKKSSLARWSLFLILIGGLITAGTIPASRYYVLNKAGVRSSASVIVTDQSTLEPLKNVTVSIAGQSANTDAEGKATLSQLPLGDAELVVEKRAFTGHKQSVTIGWGSNPLPDVGLKPEGSQYSFVVKDKFSGNPIPEVEASVGDQTASANDKGEITLTLDKIETDKVTVLFKAGGYRDVSTELNLNTKESTTVEMTPDKQVAFISKRSGQFDLYKIDADGKNEALVLKASGKEANDIVLIQHPTESVVMLVSSRDGTFSSDGKRQKNLTFVNLKDGTNKSVAKSSQLQAIDWIGNRLVYVMQDDNVDQEDPNRYKLMSYDFVSGDNRQLASTNYFNSVLSAGSKIYYAPASAYQNGVNLGVFVVHPDGSGKQVLLDKESWNMIRTTYDSIIIAVEQDWYSYTPGANKPEKLAGQPTNTTSQIFTNSPDGKHSAWVDSRDGKGVVVIYDAANKSEKVLATENGLSGPIRWLNNATIVYRVAGTKETADYVLSINGGTAQKITDVTNAAGIERWAY